jgi:hypothetical protein
MNTIQQQGDEMVEQYRPYASGGFFNIGLKEYEHTKTHHAIQCAIRSCEDTIEELKEIVAMAPLSISRRITNKKKIIEYLKTKLNV